MENAAQIEKLSKVRELLEQAGDMLSGNNKVWNYITLSIDNLDDQIAKAEGTYVESEAEARYTEPKYKEFVRDMEGRLRGQALSGPFLLRRPLGGCREHR